MDAIMKYTKIQWALALAFFGAFFTVTISTSCQNASVKTNAPAANSITTDLSNVAIHKSPNDDRSYAAILLPNNLQVVLVSDPTLENSAASLVVGVGSAQDPVAQQGLAHYLEHMLFLGTEKYPEPEGFMKYTNANGGMTNAFTQFDKTNYLFQINASKFDEALDRFSDYFKNPSFDATYSDKERNAVNNEWSMKKSDDNRNLYKIMGATANAKNPITKFSTGNLTTLMDKPGSILNDELKEFYKHYYSANIMRLTLVGKQPLPELKKLAEKHFSSIENKNIIAPSIEISGITPAEMAKSIHYKPIKDLKSLSVDFPISSNKKLWRLKPNEYVHSLMSSEELGTLGEQLRTLGFATGVSAFVQDDLYGQDGVFHVQVDLTDAGLNHQDDIIAAVFAYTNLIKREGLNENYFRELKVMREKDFLNANKQNPLQQAIKLSMQQFEVPVENVLDSDFIYDHYDPLAIRELLDQLDSRNARIWHVGPQEVVDTPVPYADGKYSVRDITPTEYAKWEALEKKFAFKLPPLNNLFTDKPAPIVDNKYLKPHLVLSQAGLEAFILHSQYYREDKGQLTLEINSPHAQKSLKNRVLSYVLTEIYKKQNVTLVDRAYRASLGLTIANSEANSQAIYLSGYTTKHAVLLNELLVNFAHLTFSPQVFSEALISYKQSLKNENKDQLGRQLYGHFNRLTYTENWRNEERLAAAEKIILSDVVAYYKAIKSDPVIRILAAGNYSEEAVSAMAVAAAKVLPSTRMPSARATAKRVTPKAGKMFELKDSVAQADSALLQAWFRENKSDDENAQLNVLNSLFSMAFFAQVRTNEQLGYAVQSFDYGVDDVAGFIMLVQSSNSDLGKIKSSMDKFRAGYLATLKATAPAEIEQSKQAIIANILQKPTDFYKEAAQYNNEFLRAKYNFDARERELAALQKVTKEDLIKIYEALLLNQKSSGMLLQLRGTNFKDAAFAPAK
jgi:protease III